MQSVWLILLCAIFTYPYEAESRVVELHRHLPEYKSLDRLKREVEAQVVGSLNDGFDLNIGGNIPLWESEDGKHSIGLSGGFSQHLGGPSGDSDPGFHAGAAFNFNF